jgi:hypothetical protein
MFDSKRREFFNLLGGLLPHGRSPKAQQQRGT